MEKYQTLSLRFWALVLDGILLLPLEIVDETTRDADISPNFKVAALIVINLASTLYFISMHGFCGQTVGKMLMKVKVLSLNEKPLRFYQAILRDTPQILFTISSFIFLRSIFVNSEQTEITPQEFFSNPLMIVMAIWGLADILTVFFNVKRRALHDYVAGSVVVKIENAQQAQ